MVLMFTRNYWLGWKYPYLKIYFCLYVIIMSRRVNPHSIVCMNVEELLAWSRRNIWSLSDSNVIRTHNHLVRKRRLNHLAKLAKSLSCVVSTYLYGAFDSMLLSCHVPVTVKCTVQISTHNTAQSFGQLG